MKYFCTLIVLGIFFFNPALAHAGAAVAAQKQKAATKAQLQKERQLLQQKVVLETRSKVSSAVAEHTKNFSTQTKTSRVSLEDFWQALDRSSEPWLKIVKPQDKVMVIQHYIDAYAQHRVMIRKGAEHYVPMIDNLASSSPKFLHDSFDKVLQAVATIEYDFDNGWNKDDQARQLLGSEEAFLNNKKRLGLIK